LQESIKKDGLLKRTGPAKGGHWQLITNPRLKVGKRKLSGTMNEDKNNDEPAWLDPANDRKTPYTDEEIELFVNDFIEQFPDHYAELLKNDGPNTARIILRNRFRSKEQRGNL